METVAQTSQPGKLDFVDAYTQGQDYIRATHPTLYNGLRHHRTTDGDHLSFEARPWLLDIYKDQSRRIVIKKCVQVGITEYCICAMIAHAQAGRRGLYLLPDDTWVSQWVADRIDGLLEKVSAYRAMFKKPKTKETDSRRLKTICGQNWKFAGTHSKTEGNKRPKHAFEFAARVLIIDERDEHDQDALPWFKDRLAAQAEKFFITVGNPTMDGMGIDAEYQKTNANKWHVACNDCGHEQVLDWWQHFVVESTPGSWLPRDTDASQHPFESDPRPVCTSCQTPFDRLGAGRWIATNSGGVGSGREISHLFVGVGPDDIREMFDMFIDAQHDPSKMQNFCNQWLGITFANNEQTLNDGILSACVSTAPLGYAVPDKDDEHKEIKFEHCTAGVDQGKDFHVQISEIVDGRRVKRYIGVQKTWDGVRAVLKEFGCTTVVVDAQGGGYDDTREFVKTYDGALMCYYRPKDQVKKAFDVLHKDGVVNTNRTEACDRMVASYKKKETILPPDYASIDGGQFRKQMITPTRTIDPQGRPIWTKGVDHYFHADVYDDLAFRISGMSNSKREPTSWRVR